jgi:hypothetical protein
MQIHEITRRRTNEGVLSGIAGAAKAVGSQIAAKANDWATKTTGTDFSKLVPNNPYGAQQSRAAVAAKPVIEKQAIEQQKLWTQALTQTMRDAGATNLAALPSAKKGEVEKSLLTQLHANLLRNSLGRDYTQLGTYVDKDPGVQAQAQDIVKKINDAKNKLMNFASSTYDADSKQGWQELAQGAYEAMSLAQFQRGGAESALGTLTSRLGLAVPAIDAVKILLRGATPVRTPSSDTLAYLEAYGFNPYRPVGTMSAAGAAAKTNIESKIGPAALTQINRIVSGLPTVTSGGPEVEDWLQTLGFRL